MDRQSVADAVQWPQRAEWQERRREGRRRREAGQRRRQHRGNAQFLSDVRAGKRFGMMQDDVGRKSARNLPLPVEEAPYQRAHLLQQADPRAEAAPACDGGLALRRIDQREKLARQRRERYAISACFLRELLWRGQLRVMAPRDQPERQRQIGLDITTRAERLDGDAHGASRRRPDYRPGVQAS